jgi:formylglycine-generating enzyme required for sulfatase activity
MRKKNLYLMTILAVTTPALMTSCSKNNPAPPPTASILPAEIITKSGVSMVYVPGGTFAMGNDKEADDEKPAHTVTLTGFLMDKYEVYGELFVKAELSNPSHRQGAKMPIEQVRWRDARMYCNERSILEGLTSCYDESKPNMPLNINANGYRLPTEAEWEYAARAGGKGHYGSINSNKLRQYAVYEENSQKRTRPIGTKKPNALGLYDMLGNVSEWCEDVYEEDYYANSPSENPTGPDAEKAANKRVMRGGSWKSSADMCRVTFRTGQMTGDTDACFTTDYCGFRCVRRITQDELKSLQATDK